MTITASDPAAPDAGTRLRSLTDPREDGFIRRVDALRLCREIAATATHYALHGQDKNFRRLNEASEATATGIRHEIALLAAPLACEICSAPSEMDTFPALCSRCDFVAGWRWAEDHGRDVHPTKADCHESRVDFVALARRQDDRRSEVYITERAHQLIAQLIHDAQATARAGRHALRSEEDRHRLHTATDRQVSTAADLGVLISSLMNSKDRVPTAEISIHGPVDGLGMPRPDGSYYLVSVHPKDAERERRRISRGEAEMLRDELVALLATAPTPPDAGRNHGEDA